MLNQYDKLRKRNAFMEMYKKEKMFKNGLEEFDVAWYVFSVSNNIPLANPFTLGPHVMI